MDPGGGGRRWTSDELRAEFAGSRLVARTAGATPAEVPAGVGEGPAFDRLWVDAAAQLHPSDRSVLARAWRRAVERPSELTRVVLRRNDDDAGWRQERVTFLNLLDQDEFGVVLVGLDDLGACEPPAPGGAEPDRAEVSEGASVLRPAWVLQELDPLGVVLSTEGDVAEIFGRGAAELAGRLVLEFIHPDDHPVVIEAWAELLGRRGAMVTMRERILHPDGTVRWIEASVMNRLAADGTGSLLSLVHDVTERRHGERALRDLATTDPLTGLLNRGAVLDELRGLLRSDPVAVGFLDLDGFKLVNDRHGHHAGDDVLAEFAARLIRSVPAAARVGRWGGDEFVLFCRSCDVDGLGAAVEHALEGSIDLGGPSWDPGASVGIVIGRVGADPVDLVRSADREMYRVKLGRRPDLPG